MEIHLNIADEKPVTLITISNPKYPLSWKGTVSFGNIYSWSNDGDFIYQGLQNAFTTWKCVQRNVLSLKNSLI